MGPARTKSTAKAAPKKKAASAKRTSSGGTPTWQKTIDATAFLGQSFGDKVPRQKVASLCGFPDQTKSSWANSLTDLTNKKKYIGRDKEFIWLTALGKQHAKTVDPASGNQDMWEKAKEKATSSKGKAMIDMLSDGRTYSRVEVAETLGMKLKSSSFANTMSSLRTADVLEYAQGEAGQPGLRLPEWLFPFGRPGANGDGEEVAAE
jgi:hypothetical protein